MIAEVVRLAKSGRPLGHFPGANTILTSRMPFDALVVSVGFEGMNAGSTVVGLTLGKVRLAPYWSTDEAQGARLRIPARRGDLVKVELSHQGEPPSTSPGLWALVLRP